MIATNDVLIEVNSAAFGYGSTPVVRVESLRLRAGRCLGVFGPNGAGKTTLVRGVTGLLPPLAGGVRRTRALRFGYLPQHRAMEPHWPMTGLDAASMAISARRWFGWVSRDRRRVGESMRTLGVDSLARRSFAKLSGGQQQRLLLAGALAADPDVLVLDEPTDGLDARSRASLLELLADFTARGLCTVVISHEVEDLLQLSTEVAWLHAGRQEGEASTVEQIETGALAERMLAARKAR